MLIVLDTNVLVASLRSRQGAFFQILTLIIEEDPRFQVLLSVPLFLEYEAVLKREEQLVANRLQLQDIDDILNMLAYRGKEVKISYLWRPQLPDPKDEMVLEVAIHGQADALITFNQKNFWPAASHFHLEILSPKLFYEQLKRCRS